VSRVVCELMCCQWHWVFVCMKMERQRETERGCACVCMCACMRVSGYVGALLACIGERECMSLRVRIGSVRESASIRRVSECVCTWVQCADSEGCTDRLHRRTDGRRSTQPLKPATQR
jgi:hypothetical protein